MRELTASEIVWLSQISGLLQAIEPDYKRINLQEGVRVLNKLINDAALSNVRTPDKKT